MDKQQLPDTQVVYSKDGYYDTQYGFIGTEKVGVRANDRVIMLGSKPQQAATAEEWTALMAEYEKAERLAKLFAAAPQLAKALQMCLAWRKDNVPGDCGCTEELCCWHQAQAAIAAAGLEVGAS